MTAKMYGPLTAEEWLEFCLQDDDEVELLRCCANTSEVRDMIFGLLRNGPRDHPMSKASMLRIWQAMQEHGMPGGRGDELLNRMRNYYLGEKQ